MRVSTPQRSPEHTSICRRRPHRFARGIGDGQRHAGAPRQDGRTVRRVVTASFAMLLATILSCAPTVPPAPGTFVEEFDGFPIFHGDPGRPYRVLGGVFQIEAAERGTSPMKRAAVAEARRLGANAILLGLPATTSDATAAPNGPPGADVIGAEGKWKTAVAIQLLD